MIKLEIMVIIPPIDFLKKMRPSGRKPNELRDLKIQVSHNSFAEGSCLISLGKTLISCTATVESKTPKWVKNSKAGWVTAEYSLLPRSTISRNERESKLGSQSGRTQEIQRFIGRSLRASVDLKVIEGNQIIVDCDVLGADGGTRTLSVTGGYIALYMALYNLWEKKLIPSIPIIHNVAAISCGIYKGIPIIDFDYNEDSDADADANFVFTKEGSIVELQGTSEKTPFSQDTFSILYGMAWEGVKKLFDAQNKAIEDYLKQNNKPIYKL